MLDGHLSFSPNHGVNQKGIHSAEKQKKEMNDENVSAKHVPILVFVSVSCFLKLAHKRSSKSPMSQK
jgi:hypothetical protein